MVKFHLFVVERKGECDGAENVVIGQNAQDPPQSKAKTDAVVLKVSVVDQDETGLEEEEEGEEGLVEKLLWNRERDKLSSAVIHYTN